MVETGFAPTRTGILCNTHSGRLRKRRKAVQRAMNDFASASIREACTPAEVAEALHAFASENIDLLVVAGFVVLTGIQASVVPTVSRPPP